MYIKIFRNIGNAYSVFTTAYFSLPSLHTFALGLYAGLCFGPPLLWRLYFDGFIFLIMALRMTPA